MAKAAVPIALGHALSIGIVVGDCGVSRDGTAAESPNAKANSDAD